MTATIAAAAVGLGGAVQAARWVGRAATLYKAVNKTRSFRAALYVTRSDKTATKVYQTFSNGTFMSSAHSFVYHYAKHGGKYGSAKNYLGAASSRLKEVAGQASRAVKDKGKPGGRLNPARTKWHTFW